MLLIELLKAVLFGLVQGITEWLPISSTGHMILLDELVHLRCTPEFWNTFLVVIQLGSILAVVVLYFHQLNPFSPQEGSKPEDRHHLPVAAHRCGRRARRCAGHPF